MKKEIYSLSLIEYNSNFLKFSLVIFFIIIQMTSFGQSGAIDKIVIKKDDQNNNNITDSTIYSFSAKYRGGDQEMGKFIRKNVKYPEKAKLAKIDEVVILNFIVEEDGSLTNIKILKEIPNCSECGLEAIRVVKLMPKWLPAFDKNKVIRSPYNLAIRFSY